MQRWICLAAAALAAGCVFSGRDSAAPAVPAGALRILIKPAALAHAQSPGMAPLDSIFLRVTAADMEPVEFSFSGDSLDVTLTGLPAGVGRLLSAALFRAGRLLYAGQALCDLRRETGALVALRCDPRFSRVTARFHLPILLPVPVAGGRLRLSGAPGVFEAPLRLQGEIASFFLDEVPGDARYDVGMALTDAAGKELYRGERNAMLLPLGEEAAWDLPLVPTEATAAVALSLGSAPAARLLPGFPSRRRKPAVAGEIILTEFYAAPSAKDSSTEGEWWEIFNRTPDTLELEGCRLSRDRSGGVTRSYAFPGGGLLPGEARAYGRAAAPAAVHYADFTLVNTTAALLLLCAGDSLALDSLRYSTDSAQAEALPVKEGWVNSLNPERLGQRSQAASWCLTRLGDSAGWAASPGSLWSCLP